MKLLYITNGIYGVGGLERVLSIKASYFADVLNYEVHIVTLNEHKPNPFYQFSDRIIFHHVQAKGNAFSYLSSYIKGINKVVAEVNPNVISVCDDGLKGLYVPLWIKKRKALLIYERHASMALNNSQIQSYLMKLGGLLYDKIVVLTQYNLTEWIGHNQVVIPNPISFIPQEKSSLNYNRIICVGSISYNKGYDLLIEAWRLIAKEFPQWRIDIYGKGDSTDLQKLVRDYNLSDNVHFMGVSNHIQDEMIKSSFLVLPSRSEGFGMVLIEAMACGLPCISFDCPCGPRDIIEDKVTGLLVPPLDVKQLVEAIKQLITNPNMRKQMGVASLKAIDAYKIENISCKWQNLFERN